MSESLVIIKGILPTSILAVGSHKLMINSGYTILLFPKDKAGPHKDIYPYVIQELKPVLEELGISTPEELGIDKL